MNQKEFIKNLEMNNRRFELKYINLINMIEKEDDKSKSYYNNSLILLTVESTLIIALLLNINNSIADNITTVIIFLFNSIILLSIMSGVHYFKNSLDNRDIVTIEPSEELNNININYTDYIIQINQDYEKTNFKNRNLLNNKRFNNNNGIKVLRYGLIYLSFFLIYISFVLLW